MKPNILTSVQSLSHVWLFATPWIAAHKASLYTINPRSSLRFTSIESVMPYRHIILYCPLLLLPSIPPSIKLFSNESTLRMRRSKYWSFSFSIIPFKQIPGLISFTMDWLDLLAGQGTLRSPLQHHSSKGSILWCSAFFTVQLSHPYMTTGKTIALTRLSWQSNVSAFEYAVNVGHNISSKEKAFFNFMAAITICSDFGDQKIQFDTVSTSISHEVMGPDAMSLVFWMLNFKPTFHFLLSLSSRGFLVPLHFLP